MKTNKQVVSPAESWDGSEFLVFNHASHVLSDR